MFVKVKGKFEKTRLVKNNDKSKKYILCGQRNVRYQERILSTKTNLKISPGSRPWKKIVKKTLLANFLLLLFAVVICFNIVYV